MLDAATHSPRDRHDQASTARPVNYLLCRDGRPFAILNAPPALAERTIAGFSRAEPQARWSVRPL